MPYEQSPDSVEHGLHDSNSNYNANLTLSPQKATNADIERLRTPFASKSVNAPLGWPAVHVSLHTSIILPEPYRTFVAEIADGCNDGPPHYGLQLLSKFRDRSDSVEARLAFPFPLTKEWIWAINPELPEDFPSFAIDEEGEADIFDRGCLDLGTDGGGLN